MNEPYRSRSGTARFRVPVAPPSDRAKPWPGKRNWPKRAPRPGACLTQVRLLRPTRIGILPRSFRLHSPCYARVTIAASRSMGVGLATAPLSQTGSQGGASTPRLFLRHLGTRLRFGDGLLPGHLATGFLLRRPGARLAATARLCACRPAFPAG